VTKPANFQWCKHGSYRLGGCAASQATLATLAWDSRPSFRRAVENALQERE